MATCTPCEVRFMCLDSQATEAASQHLGMTQVSVQFPLLKAILFSATGSSC